MITIVKLPCSQGYPQLAHKGLAMSFKNDNMGLLRDDILPRRPDSCIIECVIVPSKSTAAAEIAKNTSHGDRHATVSGTGLSVLFLLSFFLSFCLLSVSVSVCLSVCLSPGSLSVSVSLCLSLSLSPPLSLSLSDSPC